MILLHVEWHEVTLKEAFQRWDVAQMAECLSSMYKVLGSVPALRRPGVVVYNCNPRLRMAATTEKVFHRAEKN